MKLIILFFLFFFYFNLSAQIITTVAGCDTCSCECNGNIATYAHISEPYGCTFDKNGNFYFSDRTNFVKKISKLGIISLVAGNEIAGYSGDGSQATDAELFAPSDVAIDSFGNIFIVDAGNHVIRKVNISNGIISTIAGTGVSGFSGDGDIALNAKLSNPVGICFDKNDNIYITDRDNYRIRKINNLGIISTFAGKGISGFSGDNGLATNAEINFPFGITSDNQNNIYFADPGNFSSRIRKIDTNGFITTVVGNGNSIFNYDNIIATSASLSPWFIKFDKFNNLFISDQYNSRVYKVSKLGIFNLIGGNGSNGYNGDGELATFASLFLPYGIAIDSCDNINISDLGNNRIRKITYPHCNYLEAENLEKEANGLSIYPNPAFDVLNIKYNKIIKDIIISNITGQKIYEKQNIGANSTAIDISYLKSGLYFIKVDENQWQKWIKE